MSSGQKLRGFQNAKITSWFCALMERAIFQFWLLRDPVIARYASCGPLSVRPIKTAELFIMQPTLLCFTQR